MAALARRRQLVADLTKERDDLEAEVKKLRAEVRRLKSATKHDDN